MARRLGRELEETEKKFLMDTLKVIEPSVLNKPRSHSSICLTEDHRSESEGSWCVGDASSMNSISMNSLSPHAGHSNAIITDENRELPLCRISDVGGEPSVIVVQVKEGENDLSKKARWFIIITAVVLVLMSILLVGITLRLAPVIDDLVRKENEEMLRVIEPQATPQPMEGTNQTLLTTGHPG